LSWVRLADAPLEGAAVALSELRLAWARLGIVSASHSAGLQRGIRVRPLNPTPPAWEIKGGVTGLFM